MNTFRHLFFLFLLALSSPLFAQVQIDKQVLMTGGSSADRQIKNIGLPTDSGDVMNVKAFQTSAFIYAVSTGSGGNYHIDLSPPLSAYFEGMTIKFKASTGNSGAVTLSVNSLSQIPVKRNGLSAGLSDLNSCNISTGQIVEVVYDGSVFQLVSPVAADLAVSASSSNTLLCPGSTTIQLNSSSNSIGVNYSWTGPNGFSSNQQNPIVTGATSANTGTYTVTASLGSCSATSSVSVTVVSNLSVTASSTDSVICSVSNLNLFAAGNPSGVTYAWTGPGGFTSTQQNPVVSTPASGAYIVTASLSGCQVSSTVNVLVLAATSNKQKITNSGSDQTFNVPAGVYYLHVKLWGAGGGGNQATNNGNGGPGGYTETVIPVTPFEALTVVVGSGGSSGCVGDCSPYSFSASAYGGGGSGAYGDGGGGLSGIFRGSIPLVIAGGGGGGGGGGNSYAKRGGGGGGSTGQHADDATYGGAGGTQTAGGAPGATTSGGGPSTAGSYLQGGSAYNPSPISYGGGGGGGYYGGGGGNRAGSWLHEGGGGGSSYLSSTAVCITTTLSGDLAQPTNPPNSSDSDYTGGIGYGGTNGNGGNGLAVIYW